MKVKTTKPQLMDANLRYVILMSLKICCFVAFNGYGLSKRTGKQWHPRRSNGTI